MKFLDKQHEYFYYDSLKHSQVKDVYHKALFYALGTCEDTRKRIQEIYDFNTRCINTEILEKGWQTSGSRRACLLAFNLFNGYMSNDPCDSTPYYLFCDSNAEYYFEAIKLRYPEYTQQKQQEYERC